MKAVCFFRGYYPKGGGKITVEIPPVQHLNSVELVDPGKVTKIWGTAFTAGNCPYAVSLNLSSYCFGIVLPTVLVFVMLDSHFTPFVFFFIR